MKPFEAVSHALLVGGLIFPTVSLLTCALSAATRWKSGRYASPVFIPFVGPILLTSWVLVGRYSTWIIPVVWLLDLGTLAFIAVLPWLMREWWNTSLFTRINTLRGTHGIQHAILTLHSSGRYLLKRSWDRPNGELGVVFLGELGTFVGDGDIFTLESDSGLKRQLSKVEGNSFAVEEWIDERQELRDYSLDGWRLESCDLANKQMHRNGGSARI